MVVAFSFSILQLYSVQSFPLPVLKKVILNCCCSHEHTLLLRSPRGSSKRVMRALLLLYVRILIEHNFWNNSYLPFGQNFNNSQISGGKTTTSTARRTVHNGKKKLNAIKRFHGGNCSIATPDIDMWFTFGTGSCWGQCLLYVLNSGSGSI